MKQQRKCAWLLALLLFFTASFSVPAAAALSGDANGDGRVNSVDARLALRFAARIGDLDDDARARCDMDGNGKVNSADARVILRIAAHILTVPADGGDRSDAPLYVRFLDVGQADCVLIEHGEDAMLIDGGNVADSDTVLACLRERRITSLDYVIGTHAHEDHIGALGEILTEIPVERAVFAPRAGASSRAYANFVSAVEAQGKTLTVPTAGQQIALGDITVLFLGPIREDAADLNNTSIVVKLVYGGVSFLFTGDASREEELDILDAGADLQANVLKVGHHGSESSTAYVFLRAVMPQFAVISVGANNAYGHPDEAVLSRLRDADVTVYRTDLQGAVTVETDGKTLHFSTEKTATAPVNPTQKETEPAGPTAPVYAGDAYIGNLNSKIFHLPTCSRLPKESNRIYFAARESAVANGYTPCKICNP